MGGLMTVRIDGQGVHQLSDGPEARQEEQDALTAEEQARDDMRLVLREPAGRRAVYEIIAATGAFMPVHGERMAGSQEVGMHIIARVKDAGLSYWHKMLGENEA